MGGGVYGIVDVVLVELYVVVFWGFWVYSR